LIKNIKIQNLAIIDELDIKFGKGLNILTGETGAGKSIILDSIKFVGGERADKTLLRNGEKRMVVEAVFEFEKEIKELKDYFEDSEDRKEVIIRREFFEDGRNKIFINNISFKLSFLKELSKYFFNIYGQNDHRYLLNIDNQLEYLDEVGKTDKLLLEIGDISKKIGSLKKQIREIEDKEREKTQREEYLKYVISEIEEIGLSEGMEKELLEKRVVYRDSELIFNTIKTSLQFLYDDDDSILNKISEVENNFEILSKYKKDWEKFYSKIVEFRLSSEEVSYQLRDFIENYEFSPEELDEIEKKLSKLENLKKKHGESEKEILDAYEKAKKELELLNNIDIEKDELLMLIKNLKKEYDNIAEKLTEKRKSIASDIEKKVVNELKTLGMKNPKFEIKFFENKDNFSPMGKEYIEFYFSANPGETIKPLSKVASGGELSRIMLSLKLLSVEKNYKTFIFDEIDSGVGGETAEKLGEKLKQLSKKAQVLCITHFPQVASFADNHFKVDKREENKRTFAEIRELNEKEKIKEIARMMSGTNITENSLKSAEELIKRN
jgi:DNA repair protein RecN (Recombination protein N)